MEAKVQNDTIKASYTYTYDNADNLTEKVTPFEDNFDDNELDGWSVSLGTWKADNGALHYVPGAASLGVGKRGQWSW